MIWGFWTIMCIIIIAMMTLDVIDSIHVLKLYRYIGNTCNRADY